MFPFPYLIDAFELVRVDRRIGLHKFVPEIHKSQYLNWCGSPNKNSS